MRCAAHAIPYAAHAMRCAAHAIPYADRVMLHAGRRMLHAGHNTQHVTSFTFFVLGPSAFVSRAIAVSNRRLDPMAQVIRLRTCAHGIAERRERRPAPGIL